MNHLEREANFSLWKKKYWTVGFNKYDKNSPFFFHTTHLIPQGVVTASSFAGFLKGLYKLFRQILSTIYPKDTDFFFQANWWCYWLTEARIWVYFLKAKISMQIIIIMLCIFHLVAPYPSRCREGCVLAWWLFKMIKSFFLNWERRFFF